MNIGSFNQKAHPVLSIFVMACCITITGLLFVVEKAQETRDALAAKGDYSIYNE